MMFFTLYYKALAIIESNWSKHRNLWLCRLVVWFYIVVQMKPTLITCNKLRLIVYALKWHVFDQSAKHAVSSKVNLSLLNTNTYVLSKQWQYLNYITKWAYYFLNVTPNVFMGSIYPTNLTPSFSVPISTPLCWMYPYSMATQTHYILSQYLVNLTLYYHLWHFTVLYSPLYTGWRLHVFIPLSQYRLINDTEDSSPHTKP